MSLGWRIFQGGLINQILLWPMIALLAGVYMTWAGLALGVEYAWPQINFMSSYASDARNGYLLFVAAVFTMVFLFSGLIAGFLGASPGKAISGLRYVDASGQRCGMGAFIRRAMALLAMLSLIFLAGPVLGFVIGEAADTASMLCLLAGFALLLWVVTPIAGRNAPLNRYLGMEPMLSKEA